MSYSILFKKLDESKREDGASVIDESIIKYGKLETVEAIDYIAYFMETSSFRKMEYWRANEKDNKYKAIQYLSETLKNIYPKLQREFEYLATR